MGAPLRSSSVVGAPVAHRAIAACQAPCPRRAASIPTTCANQQSTSTSPASEPAVAATRRAVLFAAAAAAALPTSPPLAAHADDAASGRRVFFDISVDRKPLGRIVVEVDPSIAPVGAQRFLDLAVGKEGVGYRRTKMELIQDGYVQGTGVKALSYKASGRTAIAGGLTTEELEDEMAAPAARRHDAPGLVSLVVLNAKELQEKEKLVAISGKFVTVTEVMGEVPNGTAFCFTTQADPSLDPTNLVVGRVVEGMEVVQALSGLRRVKDNSGSPFFQAGKAVGDKRAVVAERGFGRPFAKIVIDESGPL